jgi:hypothetical protein
LSIKEQSLVIDGLVIADMYLPGAGYEASMNYPLAQKTPG